MTHWTLRNGKRSGDVETHGTLDAGSYGVAINIKLCIFGHSENYMKLYIELGLVGTHRQIEDDMNTLFQNAEGWLIFFVYVYFQPIEASVS